MARNGRGSIAALAMLMALAGCGDNSGDDLLTRRDGSTLKGKLESCTGDGCILSGTFTPRGVVQSIRLGQQKAQDLKDPRHDEIQLTDASVHAETMIGVDAAKVTTNQQTYPRERVAWIYLAPRPAGGPKPPSSAEAPFEQGPNDPRSVTIVLAKLYAGPRGQHR